jgi:cytochrome c oxidase subunit IV
MSTTTDADPTPELPVDEPFDQHDHPSQLQYLKVAAILGIITAVEVGTYFLDDASTTLLVVTLVPMMVAKFLIVTAYFMHLKYDNPLFRRVFFFGLILAVAVFLIMLSTFEFFTDDFWRYLRP